MGSKNKLSGHVLQMKFMKKSKEKSEREADEEKRKILFESELPDELIRGGDLCIMEPSFVPCLQLTNGRFSYKGMNPEIERLMAQKEMQDPNELKKMDGLSNKEMANRYSSLVDTMKRKFTSKRKWAAENCDDDETSSRNGNKTTYVEKKLKFRKPPDA